MSGHVESELKVLMQLAQSLISGECLEIEEAFEYQQGGIKITAMPIYHKLVEYIFTIEERGDVMTLQLRSTQIPELFIALPSPLVVQFGAPVTVEELC
tara:strand:+ start:903 stop:1196 length:294 start_codon:yes stop_codon:yes gene_type:complete